MYIMLDSKPDLCYCIAYFTQFQNCHYREHWNYLKSILRYLKSIETFGLEFYKSKNKNVTIEAFVDADFSSDVNDRKSTTG